MAGTFTGGFSQFDAVVTDGVLTGSAKVASVQVKDPDLAAHLQSPEFFDAERYPELAFESSAIERTGNRIRIDGEITIKGTRNPSRSPATSRTQLPTPTAASVSVWH
jgi:polyisoprenoid-binding protein YceI